MATGTGVSAITTCLLSLLKEGDHVITFVQSYKPIRFLIRDLLAKFGVKFSFLSIFDHKSIEETVKRNNTRLILFESPINPTTRIADIEFIVELAKRNNVYTVLDNTFAGFHNHGQFEIDIFIHSLTKYASGHGDAMGGAIISNTDIISKIRSYYNNIGTALDPNSAFLILRGLKTYYLRYRQMCLSAQKIAEFLENDSDTSNLLYPGLRSHPDYELARKQMKDSGNIISFDFGENATQSREFIDRLKLFVPAFSLGSSESLVAASHSFYGGDLPDKELELAEIRENTMRLSIGLEDPGDLINDLRAAMAKV